MKKFTIKITLFLIIGYLIGEFTVRVFKLNIDIPDYYQDANNGLLKNKPNQTGYYLNGNKWVINKYGEHGYEPKSLSNLITIVGDSYIENIMNPVECSQAYLLSMGEKMYNYYPCGRSGANVIEFLEMAKSLNHLKPVIQFIYVHHTDFIDCINRNRETPKTFQVLLPAKKVVYPKIRKSYLKDFFYKFKFAYFIYRTFVAKKESQYPENYVEGNVKFNYDELGELLDFIKNNYQLDNLVFVFRPESDKDLIRVLSKYNFKTFELIANDYKKWQFGNDIHWNCYGQNEAARQVLSFLKNM